MNELLLLSMMLSANPPAELPVSVRAEMAVNQAVARTTQHTPVRAPTSSLLVSQGNPTRTRVLTQPTGVYSSFFVKAPHQTIGQMGGVINITPDTRVQTADTQATQPTSLGAIQAQVISTRVPNVVRGGSTSSKSSGCTTG